ILVRNPDYLRRLTEHRRLPAFKSREEFLTEALSMADGLATPAARLDGLRSYQHWELLRIGACDTFGLLDLRSVTAQLSLLADGFTQAGLNLLTNELQVDASRFCVLAFGKLGGEELNYSSDIDLAFLATGDATQYWTLGQRLIKALSQATGEGFLYRVDMRLRPWGSSGPLVNTPEAHLNYLRKHGRTWERQALVKARPIAGNLQIGRDFLKEAEPLIYGTPAEDVRESVRASKRRIEENLKTSGRTWGEVKSGAGSIRDIEFTVQCLQLVYGRDRPAVRARGTLNGLARLADSGLLWADEYRRLTAGYNFLRTVEHALQLRHHRQVHSLPEGERELRHLARRLDFPDAKSFVAHYEEHCRAVRSVFEKYVVEAAEGGAASPAAPPLAPHAERMPQSYKATFTAEEIADHAGLLAGLDEGRPVALHQAEPSAGDAAAPNDATV
ncbi:MAG: glutamine synthetase adenylyltransferase, partial [Planctomycetota bacterium]